MIQVLAVMAAVAAVAFLLATPILTLVGRQLVHADPLQRSDAIVVLAPGVDRVIEAADVYRQGYAPIVVLTMEPPDPAYQFLRDRGVTVEMDEERRIRILEALGVRRDAIVLLPTVVRSTSDEARVFARWVEGRPIASVILITSPAHTARSRLTFRRAVRDTSIAIRVHPSKLDRFRPESWWRSRDTLREGVIELQKLLYYGLFELF